MTLLHGRRGPPPVRPDDAVRDARQVRDDASASRSASSARSRPGTSRWRSRPGRSCPRSSAGNTVVFKPATRHARCSASASWRSSRRRACPRASLNMVHGAGARSASASSSTPTCRVISFTGSREAGVKTRRAAPLPQAHPPRAGRQERHHRDGRRRPRPGRRRHPLVRLRHLRPALHGRDPRDRRKSVYDALAAKLVARAETAAARRRPASRRPMSARSSTARRSRRSTRTREIGKDEGATLLTGGEVASEGEPRHGHFYRPTVFGDVEPGMRDRPGGDLRAGDGGHPRDATSTTRSGSRTASSTACRRRSSRAT